MFFNGVALGLPGGHQDTLYTNPIIFGDYSDPDVIRWEEAYYLISSSFNMVPGIPILRSYDLVNWQILGHAVQRLPDPLYDLPQPGKGIWAPAIRQHRGVFYIFYGDPDLGIFVVESNSPEGPWEPPQLIKAAQGWIDPCPFWDEDDQAYLIHAWAKSRVGFNSILTLHRMSADGKQILDEGITVFDGHSHHPTIEGPKLYKRNGYYYIFAPAGGVKKGWQTVLRSQNIYGPYEARIVLEQGSTPINGPHQGAWVETQSGESWFVHFQDRDAYGRIVHLQPMAWVDDWPVIGVDYDGNGIGEPVNHYRKPHTKQVSPELKIATADEFEQPGLKPQWQWRANCQPQWYSQTVRPGFLRLYCNPTVTNPINLATLPNILTQKFPAAEFEVVVKLAFTPKCDGDQAGLIIIGDDYAAQKIIWQDDQLWLTQVICLKALDGTPEKVQARLPLSKPELFLKVRVTDGARCAFSYSTDGQQFTPLGAIFQAVQGRWVGAQIGLFATNGNGQKTSGYADLDYFRVITSIRQ